MEEQAPAPDRATTTNRLRAIVAAAGISSIGDGAWVAAVPLAAAAITRDPVAIGAVSAAALLPWLVVSPFAGALVDRWPLRRTLVSVDLIRAAAVALITLAAARHVLGIPPLCVGAFIVTAGSVFHGAAAQSVVADLTDHDNALRNRTNGRIATVETAGTSLLGPPAGSVSFVIAPWLPFLGNAISFAVSAALLTAVPRHQRADPSDESEPRESVRSAIRSGMVWLARHRPLRTLALLTGAANFTTTMIYALLVLYATDEDGLGASAAAYGTLLAARAIGGLLGAPIAPRLLRRLSHSHAAVLAMAARTLLWPLLAISSSIIVAGAVLAVAGFASSVVTVSVTSARQEYTPRPMLGRVVTSFRTIGNGAGPLGALFGGIAAAWWGLDGAFWAAAGLMAGALILASRTVLRR